MIKPFVSLILCAVISMTASAAPGNTAVCSAWLPYWEAESALEETKMLGEQVETAIAFAAIFDSEDKPLMLPDTEALLRSLQNQRESGVLLSVVNDVQTAPGSYDNKSADLLRRLLKDDESISRHIEQLFRLVDTYGLTGLEIDYEAIKQDEALWERFAVFLERLYTQFSAQGLTLRVVLSWDAPKYVTLPEGPEYTVMCYNLYGGHSGPGPKADFAFLEEICRLYRPYVASTHMAFATGGFDWSTEKTRALTQLQAQQLLEQKGVEPVRDPGSGALCGSYTDESGEHTLWYADGRTLALWKQTVRKHGFVHIDLFRMGGNDLEDWNRNLFSEGTDSQRKE